MNKKPFTKVKNIIRGMGYSQNDLAIMLTERGYPITKQHLNKKLNNKTTVTYDDMVRISEIIKKEPDIFFN